jgi:hypothetical protein
MLSTSGGAPFSRYVLAVSMVVAISFAASADPITPAEIT